MRRYPTRPVLHVVAAVGFMLASTTLGKSPPPASTQPATPTIADVHSLDELLQQPLITLPGGGQYRFGLGPLDAELGPWRTVYCVEEKSDEAPPEKDRRPARPFAESTARDLGSLRVFCAWPDVQDQLDVAINKADIDKLLARPHQCWRQIVPVTGEGRAVIRIITASGREIAHAPFAVQHAVPLGWREFARLVLPYGAGGTRVEGSSPLALPIAGDLSDLPPATPPGGTTRPVAPLDEAPLKLTLKKDRFLIDAGDRLLTDMPDELVIARWWLNDKPLQSKPADRAERQSQARAVITQHVLDVGFNLPDEFKSAHAGDRVGLQILYSAGGFEQATDDQTIDHVATTVEHTSVNLAISNRLDFTLTPELLNAAK